MATRFNSIGIAGRKNSKTKYQPALKTLVVPIVAKPVATAIKTGVFLPKSGVYGISACLNITAADVGAATKTLKVGTTNAADAILKDVSSERLGLVGALNLNVLLDGEEIEYTLAGADFTTLEAELILIVQYNENE